MPEINCSLASNLGSVLVQDRWIVSVCLYWINPRAGVAIKCAISVVLIYYDFDRYLEDKRGLGVIGEKEFLFGVIFSEDNLFMRDLHCMYCVMQ